MWRCVSRRAPVGLALAAVAACGERQETPSVDDVLDGRITIHTTQTANPPEGAPVNYSSVRVLLDDGSVFDAPTDEKGDVVFEDPGLQGPVDVTVVTVADPSGTVSAFTVVGVDVPELTLGIVIDAQSPPVVSTLSGRVTGFDPGNAVQLVLYGDEVFGGAMAEPDGSYSVDVRGVLGTSAHVFAQETDASTGAVVRVAMGD